MLKILNVLFISMLLFLSANANDSTIESKYKKAIKIFKDSKHSHDFFKKSYGYAIFPNIGKGGFGIAGAYGKGRVYVNGKHIANTSVSQFTIGFQLGGQAYTQMMFFKDKNAFTTFKTGNFELGVQASAVAINVGAGATVDYDRGIAIFTSSKGGLMYEASVGGQKFKYAPIKQHKK